MKLSNMLLWSSLLLAIVPSAWGQASAIPSQPHLLVKGEAECEVMPDRFGISITLRSIDKDPGLARERAQANATKILAAFKAQHALPDSVQASALSITPEYRYEDRTQVFSGTRVQRSLVARFKSLEDVRRLLAGLHTNEELQVSGLTTSYSNEAAVRAELKRQAAQQTRESARRLADAYGVQLGGLYTITEVAPNFSYGIEAGRWPGLPAPPPAPLIDVPEPRPNDVVSEALEAGSLTLSENIYAIFLIAQ